MKLNDYVIVEGNEVSIITTTEDEAQKYEHYSLEEAVRRGLITQEAAEWWVKL